MRIGLRVPPCQPLAVMTEFAVAAERAGFDLLWVPDSQLIWRDMWATLGAMATGTDEIVLGANVTNPVTRHFSVTAGAAATLVEAAPDRFVLGIGVGDSSVRIMGRRPSRISELEAYVEDTRNLLRGGSLRGRGGKEYRLIDPPAGPVPIYVSATGPKMLQAAGEIGDGVIFVGGLDEEALAYARENISVGARRSGRAGIDLDVAVGCFCHVGPDVEYGKLLMRPYAAVFALRHPELMGEFDIEPPGEEQSLGFYPDLGHARDWDAAIEQTEWLPDPVLDMFCDRYCIIGDGPGVLARVQELAGLGVDNLYVRGVHSYRLPHDLLTGFAYQVLPHL